MKKKKKLKKRKLKPIIREVRVGGFLVSRQVLQDGLVPMEE